MIKIKLLSPENSFELELSHDYEKVCKSFNLGNFRGTLYTLLFEPEKLFDNSDKKILTDLIFPFLIDRLNALYICRETCDNDLPYEDKKKSISILYSFLCEYIKLCVNNPGAYIQVIR